MRLFVVRHGQSEANLTRTYAGQSDVPLTDAGRDQARAIAPVLAKFKFDKVYSSDLSRAVETQQLALPGYVAEQTKLLRECDIGTLVGEGFGAAVKIFGEKFAKTRDYSLFGGESSDMIYARAEEFMKSLEDQPYENVAAFSHGGMMSNLFRYVIGTDFDRTHVKSNNCAIHVFEFTNGKWKLAAWNYMGEI